MIAVKERLLGFTERAGFDSGPGFKPPIAEPEIFEYYNTGDDHAYACHYYKAQTFTPAIDHIIKKVKLKLYRQGAPPGDAVVHIRGVDGSGVPLIGEGNDLCTGSLAASTVTIGGTGTYIEFLLGIGAPLIAATMYAIVFYGDGDSAEKVWWRDDSSFAIYNRGKPYYGDVYQGEPTAWSEITGQDFMFEEWGIPY